MTFEQVRDKVINKEYDAKLPYPPYRPDFNERLKYKAQDSIAKQEYKKDELRLQEEFKKDLLATSNEYLGTLLTTKQFNALWNKAWEDGHSNGYIEVYGQFTDLVYIIKEFV